MATCTHSGSEYAVGAIVCIGGTEHRFNGDGMWEDLGRACVQGDGIVVRNEEGDAPLPAD